MALSDPYTHTIRTCSGLKLSLVNPQPDQIELEDIGRGLANKSHFAGQLRNYFSIAEHSLMVFDLLPENLKADPEMALTALLHDASEAYLGDMVKPAKVLLPEFVILENRLQAAIFSKFNLNIEDILKVKPQDKISQEIEHLAFYKNTPNPIVRYYSPQQAYELFMETVSSQFELRLQKAS